MSQSGDRVWMAFAIVLAVFLSLTVGLTLNPSLDGSARENENGGTAAVEQPSPSVDVTLTEFSIAPGELSVPAGMPVTFNVANAGVAEHDFTIEGVAGTEALAAGDTTTLEIEPSSPATTSCCARSPATRPPEWRER